MKRLRFLLPLAAMTSALITPAAFADHGKVDSDATRITWDRARFDAGATVTVKVNHDSFVTWQYPSSFTKQNVQLVVNKVISSYREYGDFNLVLKWGGFTTATSPAHGEILIIAAEYGAGARAVTSWVNTPVGRGLITIYRKRPMRGQMGGSTQIVDPSGVILNIPSTVQKENYIWKMFTGETITDTEMGSSTDIMPFDGVLMHEFGHALGLGHNEDAETNASTPVKQRTVMNNAIGAADTGRPASTARSFTWAWAFGPYTEDIDDLRALYGNSQAGSTDPTVRIRRSTAADATGWTQVTNNYAAGVANWGAAPVTATSETGFVTDLSLVFYKSHLRKPSLLIGNAAFTVVSENLELSTGNIVTSVYGDGWGGEHMATMVADITHAVLARRAQNSGRGWSGVSLNPGVVTAFSYSTPAVYKYADNTWVLCYSKTNLNQSNQLRATETDIGRVVCRVTLDDGLTWTADQVVSNAPRAMRGLSMTGVSPTLFLLSYTAATTGRLSFTTLKLIDSRIEVHEQRAGTSTMFTATEPSSTITRNGMFSARRDHWNAANSATIATRSSVDGSRFADPASAQLSLDANFTARPAVAASPGVSNLYLLDVVTK